jgi:hypothetical protein
MNGSQRDAIADQLEQIAREGPAGLSLDAALDAIAETLLPNEIGRYFEAHITVEPHPEHTFEELAEMCREFEWKASRFEVDEVDDIAGKWFMSARDTNYLRLFHRTQGMVYSLGQADTEVLRYKIEETLIDSKCGDKL